MTDPAPDHRETARPDDPDPVTAPPERLLAHGRRVLERQAFSRQLGAQLAHLAPGHAHLHLPLRADHRQQHGFVHGGVVSYLADNALTYAGGSVLGDCVTSEYKINYLRPVAGEGTLVAEAVALSSGKTQAVCRCDVYLARPDGSRQLCAAAQGTISRLPPPERRAGDARHAAATHPA